MRQAGWHRRLNEHPVPADYYPLGQFFYCPDSFLNLAQ